MMLDVPPVPELSAQGLATTAMEVFHDSGFSDDQLEAIGWDGEYVKKGVKGKVLDQLGIGEFTKEEKNLWVTEVWELAHQFGLVTKDVKKDPIFSLLNDHIQTINDTASIVGIGKGLEQSIEAAEEVEAKFYKLRRVSDTRFAAYFEGSISNIEKRIETTIAALRKRTDSSDKIRSRIGLRICSRK